MPTTEEWINAGQINGACCVRRIDTPEPEDVAFMPVVNGGFVLANDRAERIPQVPRLERMEAALRAGRVADALAQVSL